MGKENKPVPLGAIVATALWTALVFTSGWAIGAFILHPNRAPAGVPSITGSAATAVPSRGKLFDEAWSRINEHFVGIVTTDTLREYGAIRGAIGTLNDRYTYFIEPQARSVERDHMRGQFGGIGVTFAVNDDGTVILTPRKGGAAERAGVLPNDRLIKVDGVPLPAKATAEDVAKVRGEVGTTVLITVLREGRAFDFTIVRELIQVASVEWRAIERGTNKVGVIQIRQFTERTGAEVKQAMDELKAAGVARWVLDLRDNGGGLLTAAIDVSSEFLADGNVLIELKRDQPEKVYAVKDTSADSRPMVVLINGNTASASEIVAGALRDAKRARLIGEKSFGKGSVQLIFELSDGSSVHVTHAKWLTPSRNEIDGKGLRPDVEVARQAGEAERGADTQLDKALDVVIGM
jgi:carboxyl-terminal processing protease